MAEARKALAASLAEAAAQASQSETAKEASASDAPKDRPRTDRTAKPAKMGSNRAAVLSNLGEQQHRERMQIVWGAVGLGVVLLVAWLLFSLRSQTTAALDVFCGDLGEAVNYPKLGMAIRDRAWLTSSPAQPEGVALFRAFGDVSQGPERVFQGEQLQPLLAELKGLQFTSELAGWSEPDQLPKLRLIAARPQVDLMAEASRAKLRFVSNDELRKRIEAAGLDPDLARMLVSLILGKPASSAPDFAKRLITDGEIPARIRLMPFHGAAGDLKEDVGRPPYRSAVKPFRGFLLRFDDPSWPKSWRIIELAVAEK